MIEGLLTASVVLMLALWVSAGCPERQLPRGAEADSHLCPAQDRGLAPARRLASPWACWVALSTAGIDITALGVLGGALGVGLGFGLQKLAANYVSGFVVLNAPCALATWSGSMVSGRAGISDIKDALHGHPGP